MTSPSTGPTNPAKTAEPLRRTESDRQAELAAAFRGFAEHRAGRYAPFTAALARHVAESPTLLTIAATARPGQSRPDLLLAALHRLVLDLADRAPQHPVVASYTAARHLPTDVTAPEPTSSSPPRPAGDELATDLGRLDHVLEFAHDHRDAICELVETRTVQTNEIGRASFLYPGLAAAAHHTPDRPLALIEVGASAGLNLVLDHYQLLYHPEQDPAVLNSPASDVLASSATAPIVHCQVRGPHRPPLAPPPPLGTRLGLDLQPLDPRHGADRQWLRALIWPDHGHRRDRLDHALGTAIALAARGELPTVQRAEARDVASLIDQTPPDEHPVIMNCAVAAHMTPTDREHFTRAVLAASRRRSLSWLQAEPRADGDPRRLRLQHCDEGQVIADHALARYHPHGAWLMWASNRS